MAILNMGSINIDHVYQVLDFVAPGETLLCQRYHKGLGGKGMNQSIALHRAGAPVRHVGLIGAHDTWVRLAIEQHGIGLDDITEVDGGVPTGHAIIQINRLGQNCILLFPGANHAWQPGKIRQTLQNYPDDLWVLVQNETNAVAEIVALSLAQGRKLAFNAAPCTHDAQALPLEKMALLLVNELEVQQLVGGKIQALPRDEQCRAARQALEQLRLRCPSTLIVLTLGGDGMVAVQGAQQWVQPALATTVVDTTAAGDTVTGYLLAALSMGMRTEDALLQAARAAAITVSRVGATESIPFANELH